MGRRHVATTIASPTQHATTYDNYWMAVNNWNNGRPTDRPVVVIFVVGGFTPTELAEVSGVLRCAAAAARPGEGLETEVILAGTTVSTPDVVYEQIFTRPPAANQG